MDIISGAQGKKKKKKQAKCQGLGHPPYSHCSTMRKQKTPGSTLLRSSKFKEQAAEDEDIKATEEWESPSRKMSQE